MKTQGVNFSCALTLRTILRTTLPTTLLTALFVFNSSAVFAQHQHTPVEEDHSQHTAVTEDHSQHTAVEIDHSQHTQHEVDTAQTVVGDPEKKMDHETMSHGDMNHEEKNHEEMNHGEMNHDEMNDPVMNRGEANTANNARDPHAYSDGFKRDEGPYSLPATAQLHLADEMKFNRFLFNRLEYIDDQQETATRFDVQAWIGTTYNHLVIKAEGELADNSLEDSKTEVLWSRARTSFWDTQVGLRFDNGNGPGRTWLAAGVQGLAPFWFDIHATVFVGESGRTAVSFEAEYDLRLTQRLTLKPRFDINFYGKDDEARDIGSGLSDATLGLRMQYQITRQFIPYVGIERVQKFGKTADLLPDGIDEGDTRWVAGLNFWF